MPLVSVYGNDMYLAGFAGVDAIRAAFPSFVARPTMLGILVGMDKEEPLRCCTLRPLVSGSHLFRVVLGTCVRIFLDLFRTRSRVQRHLVRLDTCSRQFTRLWASLSGNRDRYAQCKLFNFLLDKGVDMPVVMPLGSTVDTCSVLWPRSSSTTVTFAWLVCQ